MAGRLIIFLPYLIPSVENFQFSSCRCPAICYECSQPFVKEHRVLIVLIDDLYHFQAINFIFLMSWPVVLFLMSLDTP